MMLDAWSKTIYKPGRSPWRVNRKSRRFRRACFNRPVFPRKYDSDLSIIFIRRTKTLAGSRTWMSSEEETLEETTCDPTYQGHFEGHNNAITALSFHPNAGQLVSSSLDKTVMIWQLKHWMPAYKFIAHTKDVLDVCYSPNGELMASASRDRSVRIWIPKVKGHSLDFKPHSSAVTSVQFSPNGQKLVTASNDKIVKLWLAHHRRFLMSFTGHTCWVTCVKFSPNGKLLVSCSDDKTIKIWDVISGQCIKTFNEIKAPARYVEFHPNGTTIGSANEDACIKLYDLRTNSLCQHYAAHRGSVNMIKFHPTGNFMLTASNDSTMKILDILEGRPIYTLKGHHVSVTSIAFSKDGKLFASGAMDGRILIWKFNSCVDGQIKNTPTQSISSITKQKLDDMDKKSNSNKYKDVHEKQNEENYLPDTLEKLHLKSDKNHYKETSTRKIKSKMANMRNIEPSERNYVANVLVSQDQSLSDAPFSNQSIKTVETLCDQVQSLYHTVNILERRLIILEKTLRKQASSAVSL